MINLPVEYEPAVKDPSEIKTKKVDPTPEDAKLGIQPYNLQEEPARKLKNWKDCPITIVTSEASFVLPNPGAVAYLKQAGVNAEEIRLVDHGIHGNGHLMMGEKNNREVLQPILDWLNKNVTRESQGGRRDHRRAARQQDRFRRAEARRSGLFLGRPGIEEGGLRHHPEWADVSFNI